MNRCDCHIHIVSLDARYPFAASRDYTPHEASAADYGALARRMGLERAVVIQPSVYGTDNTCTRDAIVAAQGRWRGIAVLPDGATAATVRELHAAGFRGVRYNLLHAHQDDLAGLEATAKLIAPFDWHIEFAARPGQLCELADRIAALPVHACVDHFARLAPGVRSGDPQLQQVLELLATGKLWIKLAGAYIVSGAGSPYDDLAPLARMLAQARPDRLVWGSNWPHPRRDLSAAENVELAALPARWGFDAAAQEAVFVTNPAELYDF